MTNDQRSLSLAEGAFRRLKTTLLESGSSPSPEAEVALRAFLEIMEAGLERRLQPFFYLSSIDTGMGKSRAIVAMLSEFISQGGKPDNGILVCLATLEEMRRMVEAVGAPSGWIGVLTSDTELNALGRPDAKAAPILLTTHQMVARRSWSPEAFDYRDEPRALKVWDEALMPVEPLTISRDSLGGLLRYRLQASRLVEHIDDLLSKLNGADAGAVIDLGAELPALAAVASSDPRIAAEAQDLLRDLGSTANRPLLVVDDGGTGKALVGVCERLPAGFAPVVIADASGRLSGVYSLWEEHRGNLVRLSSAANDYSDVEVLVWRRRNGRDAFAPGPDRKELLEAIADLINDDGESQWLVFRYKFDEAFGTDLRGLVHNDPEGRVHTLAWGSHRATNEYRHIRNVVVVGQLTYRSSAYLASAMAASGLPASKVSALDLGRLASAETATHLQQAIGRSNVRQSMGGKAGAARVFLVLSPKVPEDIVVRALPGARLSVWKKREKALNGKAAAALAYIRERLADPTVEKVSKASVREAIGITATGTFGTNIMAHPRFRAALVNEGIVVGHRHFRRATVAPQ